MLRKNLYYVRTSSSEDLTLLLDAIPSAHVAEKGSMPSLLPAKGRWAWDGRQLALVTILVTTPLHARSRQSYELPQTLCHTVSL